MKNLLFLLATIFMAGLISSCNKSSESQSGDFTIAEDEVFLLKSTEATDQVINAASFGGHMSAPCTKGEFPRFFPFKNFPDCAVVTVSNGGFPKEIIIDNGDECVSGNGLAMSGKITITISDTIINEGATMTVIFDGVTIGGKTINKEETVTNEGKNEAGNWIISSSSITTITYDDGHVTTRDFTEKKEWINGFLTPEFTDDQFYQTGGGTITVDNEIIFSRTIKEPLYTDRSCRYILSGIVEITRDGETMAIDFGDGECDNIANVTKNGVTEEIELNSGHFKNGDKMPNKNFKKPKGWW
ncbi:MAG: hypothetical protein NTX93_05100 [Bacteroidia bacterium]|nr:hypothetical protein [Bacteroidia bacterium]